MDEIITVIIKILAGILTIAGTYAMTKFKAWADLKMGESRARTLENYIAQFVAAAEQLLKEDDPDGTKRFEYVTGLLCDLGYEITDMIKAIIEAKVSGINAVQHSK